MVQQTQPGPPPGRRPPLRMVQVSRVERLTPRVLRVTFAGEELAGFEPHGPAEHIKVFFPPPGQDRPVRATYEADGRPVYPPGGELLFAAVFGLAPDSLLAWRLFLLGCEIATGGLLLDLLRRMGRRAPPQPPLHAAARAAGRPRAGRRLRPSRRGAGR